MIVVLTLFSFFKFLAALHSKDAAGFMADCPGMNRSTTFSEETKASLYVTALRPNSGLFSFFGYDKAKCQLSKRGAICVANHLDLKKKTLVIISGYMDTSFSPMVRSLAAPYVDRGRNVIVLEIFPVLFRSYPLAARVTKPLGSLLGEFLADLTRYGLSSSRLELLGGSLGAHIASYASVRYKQLTGRRPARLTGLDPAGPCFRNLRPSERFNADAAVKVDALHTNIDGFGLADAIAQVDFYANGGEYQPSMTGGFILPCLVLCSHIRAAFYWMVALKHPEKFIAIRCDNITTARHGNCYDSGIQTNLLGPKTNFSAPGIYYLPTNEAFPYYIGEEGLKKRRYGVNTYLTKTAPDIDIIV